MITNEKDFTSTSIIKDTRLQIFFRQTWIEIDKSDLHFNLKEIKRNIAKNTKIMAVVENNAYGHGGVLIANEAQKSGISWFAVSSLEEGIHFRDSGIKSNILILNNIYPTTNLQVAIVHSLIPTLSTISELVVLENLALKLNKRINFHLKIDTGMGRIGVRSEMAYSLLQKIAKARKINMSGIYTHYSVSEIDSDFTKTQLEIFANIVKFARINLGLKFLAHSANSAVLFRNKHTHFDMVRPGLSLYGLNPLKQINKLLKLKPILSWKTKIIFLKKVASGFCVSYGRTFVTNRASVIATIPVGYGDGYNRLLSNKGDVLVGGIRCPIAGKITMNMTMIDVTAVKGVSLGSEVVLIGKQGKEQIRVDELAKIQGTINYEVTCIISSCIPRIIV
ncbi:MAG: alanine racemase [Endomicrobium sp.]|jgi:alanine racemase|nr:alanine racemase [Endomicrobium sp.]